MTSVALQRCFHHARREAVARCPDCRAYYCRECITEHEDRIICAACLKRRVEKTPARRLRWTLILRIAEGLIGLLITWTFFYCLGRALILMPTSFHEGTVWEAPQEKDK